MLSKNEQMLVEFLEDRSVSKRVGRVTVGLSGTITFVLFDEDGEPTEVVQNDVPDVFVRVRSPHYQGRGYIGINSASVEDVEDVKVYPHYDSDEAVEVVVDGRVVPSKVKYVQSMDSIEEV